MATTNFAVTDVTKVLVGGRWTSNATQLLSQGNGGDIRFSFTGTDLKINHAAGGTGAIDVSIDGGAYTLIATTNTASKTLVTLASGLSEATHTVIIRLNLGYTNGGFKIWLTDGIEVTGAAPAISAYPNMDTSGVNHLLWTSRLLQTNYRGVITPEYENPPFPAGGTGVSSHTLNCRMRFRTDGAKLWIWSRAGGSTYGTRLYIDGFAVEERNGFTLDAGTSNPAYGWQVFDLPNDAAYHEIAVWTRGGIDSVMVSGATAIEKTSYYNGCEQSRLAILGDSVLSGDSATGYTNSTGSFDVLTEMAMPNRFTVHNRGTAGDTVTAWLSNGRTRTNLRPIDPDIVVSFMGVNDISGLVDTTTQNAKRDEYIVMYTQILNQCPRAKLYQFAVTGLKTGTSRDRLDTAQSDAITSVAASFPARTVQFIAADITNWVTDPTTATAGFTRAGDHPYPSGYCVLAGYNHAAVVLSAQPSGGDSVTMTVGGTAYTFTFDAGSHGASPNPVTIGAAVSDTIVTLKNVMLTVLGYASMVNWTSHASAGYYVGIRNCTAISDSGANVFSYRIAVDGFIDKIDAIAPAAPSSGVATVIGG